MQFIKHFKTITQHKIVVCQLCFRIGLYKQGLLHDLSKYSLTEFLPGVKYYQGTRSPNAAERIEKGYSSAWLHHKGRNKHHWEYWVDFTHDGPKGAKMPKKYLLEMFCDRVAASKIYQGKNYDDSYPLQYYLNGRDYYIMHQDSADFIYHLLSYLAIHGLDETIDYIKTIK